MKLIYDNTISFFNNLIRFEKTKSVLVITGLNSYKNSKILEKIFKKLNNKKTRFYRKEKGPPTVQEIIDFYESETFNEDIIISIGGGSVIDFAKLISIFDKNSIQDFKNGKEFLFNQRKITKICLPTTAGSGAESTSFGVLYNIDVKFSVQHKSILNDFVLLEPTFTSSLNKRQIAVSGMDCFCQSFESLWAVNKTEKSELYAMKSLEYIIPNLLKSYYKKNLEARKKMQLGAYYSGKAINISKTTAPHAMSYYLTIKHNISHGEAVAINFEKFLEQNFSYIKINFRKKIFDLFNSSNLKEIITKIKYMKKEMGLLENINKINNLNYIDYVNSVNQERLNNNPISLTKNDLIKMFFS